MAYGGLGRLRGWIDFWIFDLQPAQEHAGPQQHAGGFGIDLRDVQDVLADSGQIPSGALGGHRSGDGFVFWFIAAATGPEGHDYHFV
jgi:hypothetical protein